jgi:hypothetical protein
LAHYLVSARPLPERLGELASLLANGGIEGLEPFGRALDYSLRNARLGEDLRAHWEEEDYCAPPLAMERASILDAHFEALEARPVERGLGWREVASWFPLWPAMLGLPRRRGERPRTRKPMPHSQLDQTSPLPIYRRLAELLFSLPDAQESYSLVSVPGARALWLDEGVKGARPEAFIAGREPLHLHPPGDGSLHMALPEAWAEEAMGKGWAELHPLAEEGLLPRRYVMVYAPRDGWELFFVFNLALISYVYARGGKVIEPPKKEVEYGL